MSGGHGHGEGGGFRKMLIVAMLVLGVVLIHRFGTRTGGFDPSAMLALGFVILASYAFGQLVGRFGLPHLTGYILAGLALGESAAHFLPPYLRVPPFDHGVLNHAVVEQLAVFNTLAVALIALAAGGQLRIDLLKRGVAHIASMISGHILIAGPIAFGFLAAISAWIPELRLPGLEEVGTTEAIAMAAIVATVAIATSPAAAVAVVAETRARGPLTEMVLAGVVLRDVFSVVLFSVAGSLAGQALGQTSEGNVGLRLAMSFGGSIVGGVVVGAVMIAYLRFIKAELLLFLTAIVFTASFVATQFGVDPVLLFIVAGFVTVNFSSAGEDLLASVSQLFLPVSVVFFTLAGAHLDLTILMALLPFALSLVAIRAIATYVGVRVGLRITRAPDVVQRLAWVAYVPQAGVALALADKIGDPQMFGQIGRIFNTLLVGGIALNEIIGPVLLKLGLTRAGEVGAADRESGEAAPTPQPDEAEREQSLLPWPVPEKGADAWGPPLHTSAPELDRAVRDLSLELSEVAQRVAEDPLTRFREDALAYVRELRREFLRHHRRIVVAAQDERSEGTAAQALRLEQAELADKWRAALLSRAARVKQQPTWEAAPIVEAVEEITDALPAQVSGAYEDASFEVREGDGPRVRLGRFWLRARRALGRLFGDGMPARPVDLRALARFHLWGILPERLEPVAALFTIAEGHLVARTRSIFDGLVVHYDALASEVDEAERAVRDARGAAKAKLEVTPLEGGAAEAQPPAPAEPPSMLSQEHIDERLRVARESVEEELMLAVQEIDRIVDDVALRTSVAIGACFRALKDDAITIGTPDLPARRRAASKLYKKRDEALRWLERGTLAGRDTSAALYNRLALEMELIALEGRVKDALEEHASDLGRDVKGRAFRQVERVQEALAASEARVSELIAGERPAAELARELREACDSLVRTSAEAARVAGLLRDQLTDERSVTRVLDALTRAAQSLTDRYRIPAGRVAQGEHRLPPQIGTVDVPFREWVLARIETSLAPRLLASTREVAAKVEPLAQSLSELERRVAFNVELAASELSIHDEEPPPAHTKKLLREMIGGTLERNRELFAGYASTSEGWGEDVRAAVREAVLSGLEELRTGIVDGDLGRIRQRIVRDVRGRQVARFFEDLRRSIRASWIIGSRSLREAVGATRLDRIRARLGLPARIALDDVGEGTFAPAAPTASIPMVYRRLFSAQALEAGDILTGRDEALRRAMGVLEGRGDGSLRAVAIVGPDGVGKSAFVNAVMRARRWPKTRELALDAPATLEQVEALFEPQSEGNLIVVSGLHWLRTIEPGGFAPLRRFVAGVIADGGKNAFLLRADSLVWAQSTQAAPLAEAFPEIVRLDPLSAEALSAAVLARHTLSGYGLVFSQGVEPESRLEEAVQLATAPLSRPQDTFFRALHAASGGLLRDALRLWLASVEEVDEAGDFVHLGPVPAPSLYALRKLADADVLTLYQVARQGWMGPRVLAGLFRIDETTAAAKLGALGHLGILEKRNGVWRIAVHLRGSVQRHLDERGYLG